MYLNKAHLVRLTDGQLCLIPLEPIKYGFFDFERRDKDCEILKTGPSVHFWIYHKNVGFDIIGNENHIASPVTGEELQRIISVNQGICYIQTDHEHKLASPSNARGERAILIHIEVPSYIESTREIDKNFVYSETSETCPFCEKEKIVSGLYLHFNQTGHPCCNKCYNKTGFNEWFNECLNMEKNIPKQLDWFVDMFYRRGITPKEAIDDMLLVV